MAITDFDANVVEKFINFIYKGECDFTSDAPLLLAFAEKYDVQELKLTCEQFLTEDLQLENAVPMLRLADLYRANFLKTEALKFINGNLKGVISSESWKSMSLELVNDVLRSGLKSVRDISTQTQMPDFCEYELHSEIESE